MTPLYNHPYSFLLNKYHKSISSNDIWNIISIESKVADIIYNNEPNPASAVDLSAIFAPFHQNGTFMIGERLRKSDQCNRLDQREITNFAGPYSKSRNIPTFYPTPFKDLANQQFIRNESLNFIDWARNTAYQDLMILKHEKLLDSSIDEKKIIDLSSVIANTFQFRLTSGQLLCDLIPNQNYIDYFRRAISLCIFHDAERIFHTEKIYDDISNKICFEILDNYLSKDQSQNFDSYESLKYLMLFSIISGSIGLDMKCSHCAASEITLDNTVFFNNNDCITKQSFDIYHWINQKTNNFINLNSDLIAWDKYAEIVLKKPCRLVFFSDDYGETIFDLFQLQYQLKVNNRLSIVIIPRAKKYHNDASFKDIQEMIEKPCFHLLRRYRDSGRVVISEYGPRNGGVEGPKISYNTANHLLNCDAVYLKGSRSYELLATGLCIPTFAGQVVNRDFSESITGIDMKVGIPILRHFYAFPDYWGFKKRHLRNEPLFPTNRRSWKVAMTSLESAKAMRSNYISASSSNQTRKKKCFEIMNEAIETNTAPHLLIATRG